MIRHLLNILLVLTGPLMHGQTPFIAEPVVVSGYITDVVTGEVLPGATVIIQETGKGTSANVYGYYSLTIGRGHTLTA
ncbi:MAG: carboxypeptidase-like regulatory domain-containing protein, partial [Bacteroidales bacterium]|nr:carboxypeptidase-like regulatory domain-containing protein [Bacteroidales bacterium]